MSDQSYPEWFIIDRINHLSTLKQQTILKWIEIFPNVTRTEFAIEIKKYLDTMLSTNKIHKNILMEDFFNLIDSNVPFDTAFDLLPNECIKALNEKM